MLYCIIQLLLSYYNKPVCVVGFAVTPPFLRRGENDWWRKDRPQTGRTNP